MNEPVRLAQEFRNFDFLSPWEGTDYVLPGRREGEAAMSAGAKAMSGGCLCGAVRFTAAPRDHDLGACHCGMCRRWSAGPFLALECGGTVKVEDATRLGVYRSSDWAERCFCNSAERRCSIGWSARISMRCRPRRSTTQTGFAFTSQIFVDEKPAYYDFANKTKNMTGPEVFAAFAAAEAKGAAE